MNMLKEITISNYKSFTNETIKFNDVTSIVGANESGKTNLLEAIYHLSQDLQQEKFSPDEQRMGAPNYPNSLIEITYTIEITDVITEDLPVELKVLKGKKIKLIKSGKPNDTIKWTYSFEIPNQAIKDIIKIDNSDEYLKTFSEKNDIELAKKHIKLSLCQN